MTLDASSIRLANSIITPFALLTTDAYLITNWTRPSDMPASVDWTVSQPDKPALRRFVPSLATGSGKHLGKYSTILSFFVVTAGMRDYIENDFLAGNGVSPITCYINIPTDPEIFAVFSGEMTSPYHSESDLSYTRVNDEIDVNVNYGLSRLELQTI